MEELRKEYTIEQIEEMANGPAYHSEPATMLRQLLKNKQLLESRLTQREATLSRVKEWMNGAGERLKGERIMYQGQDIFYDSICEVNSRLNLLSELKKILEDGK
jgi:hypothetical protein